MRRHSHTARCPAARQENGRQKALGRGTQGSNARRGGILSVRDDIAGDLDTLELAIMTRIDAIVVALAAWAVLAPASAAASEDALDRAISPANQHRHEDSREVLDPPLTEVPGSPHGRLLDAMLHAQEGSTDEAVMILEQLALDFPRTFEVHNNLALLYVEQGRAGGCPRGSRRGLEAHARRPRLLQSGGNIRSACSTRVFPKPRAGPQCDSLWRSGRR